MINVARLKTRMEEVLRNHDEVVSFAVDDWLLGSGVKRWFFFLDQHLPIHFRVSVMKGRNSRFAFWIEPFNLIDLSEKYDAVEVTVRELTASQFLSKDLDVHINELIQSVKQQIQPYITPIAQQDGELPTYYDLFEYVMNHSFDKDIQVVKRLLALGGIHDDSEQFTLPQ